MMQGMDILPSNTNPCCLHMAHFHIHQCKDSKYGKINYSSKKMLVKHRLQDQVLTENKHPVQILYIHIKRS